MELSFLPPSCPATHYRHAFWWGQLIAVHWTRLLALLLVRPDPVRSERNTQPGTPVSFWGMFIYLLFNFWKLRNFRCFPFLENSRTPMFLISGNSGLRCFLILVTHLCISHFTCDSLVFPCFMLLFSLMYSGLLSVPGTSLSHSLVYKYLYSVARTSELRLLLSSPSCPLSPSALRDLEDLPSTPLLVSSTCYLSPDLEILESRIPTLPRTRKSRIPEGFHREQGNTLSLPR